MLYFCHVSNHITNCLLSKTGYSVVTTVRSLKCPVTPVIVCPLLQLLSDISQDDKTQMTPSQLQQLVRAALQRLLASKQQQLTNFLCILKRDISLLIRKFELADESF